MIKTPYNKTFQSQNKSLIPATFKKAIISAVYPNLFSADVYFYGNSQTIIQKIPFASNVNINNVQAGDRCRVDIFDETNPNDMVVAYTYGRAPRSQFNSNTNTATTGGVTIPHGMQVRGVGVIPDIVVLTLLASGTIYEYQPADTVNIYIKSTSGSISFNWSTIKF